MTTNNDPVIKDFLTTSTIERCKKLVDDALKAPLQVYFGQGAYDELRALAESTLKIKKGHLGLAIPPNLIFVPGVMGSLLLSSKKGGIWWIDARTRGHIDDLKLSKDGQNDADPTNGIIPATVDITYEPFFNAVLKREDFNHEIFAYDWRKPLGLSADALRDMVNKVFANNGNNPIHLVAHSMGGIMVRAALSKHGAELWPKIDRIAFCGTPQYGSPAIAGYLKNHLWGFELLALLGMYLKRDTFRSLWGVLSLLPAPRGIFPGTRQNDPDPWTGSKSSDNYDHPCANFDMYVAKNWDLGLTLQETEQLQEALNYVAKFHQDLYDSHLALTQEQKDRMAAIIGVGYKSLFRLAYTEHLLGAWTSMDKVTSRVADDPHRDGDGRVTVASGRLEHVGETRYVKGVHGELPMIEEVYEDVFRWLNKEPMSLPTTPKAALTSHLAPTFGTSDAPHLTELAATDRTIGDPGYWELTPPTQERIAQLESNLVVEQLPEFNRIRLL